MYCSIEIKPKFFFGDENDSEILLEEDVSFWEKILFLNIGVKLISNKYEFLFFETCFSSESKLLISISERLKSSLFDSSSFVLLKSSFL